MKWPIFSTDRVSLLHCVDCACVLRRLYGLANGGRREALARDSKTIFHYKSLNTNWGKGSTVLVLFLSTFHYLDITSPEPPLSHLFDLFFPEVIEIYWACAEQSMCITLFYKIEKEAPIQNMICVLHIHKVLHACWMIGSAEGCRFSFHVDTTSEKCSSRFIVSYSVYITVCPEDRVGCK